MNGAYCGSSTSNLAIRGTFSMNGCGSLHRIENQTRSRSYLDLEIWNACHFGMQNFGVLSIYRKKREQTT